MGATVRRNETGAIQQRGEIGEVGIGARGWIDRLPLCGGAAVAVFDTRAHKPELLVGAAAHGMAQRLRKRGYRLVVEPESFFVRARGDRSRTASSNARRIGARRS